MARRPVPSGETHQSQRRRMARQRWATAGDCDRSFLEHDRLISPNPACHRDPLHAGMPAGGMLHPAGFFIAPRLRLRNIPSTERVVVASRLRPIFLLCQKAPSKLEARGHKGA